MRGTAGKLVMLTALSGCAVVKHDGMVEHYPPSLRTPGPAAQTAWKQHSLKTAEAVAAKADAPATQAGPVAPQTPWPSLAVPSMAAVPPAANMLDKSSGTLVSATFVEASREPSAGKEMKVTPAAPALAGTAGVAAAEMVRTAMPGAKVTPPPGTLASGLHNTPVLPPPEPPVFPPTTEVQQAIHTVAQPSGAPAVRMVNSKRIHLNFELKDVGESGVSGIELWYTQDTRSWMKYEGPAQTQPPYVVEVTGEGLWGFTMVARSGVGFSRDVPQPGELPQVWVEVDLTKPAVTVAGVELNCTPKTQALSIRWNASDKNLTARPITLSYAEKPEGLWTPIAANLENSGKFEWAVPANVPKRILVRVEAADLVGHMAAAQTPTAILIDRARPTVSILTVEPDKK